MKYYTERQTRRRAFLFGFTFGAWPSDYPAADMESRARRFRFALIEAGKPKRNA